MGGQHVTLETSLTGRGDVPISYPAQAAAQLELDPELDADVLVEYQNNVLAELHKARGTGLRLALPRGAYTAVLRRGRAISQCRLELRDEQVTRAGAEFVRRPERGRGPHQGLSAASVRLTEPEHEAWSVELNLGAGVPGKDAYTRRFEDSGFTEDLDLDPEIRWRCAEHAVRVHSDCAKCRRA